MRRLAVVVSLGTALCATTQLVAAAGTPIQPAPGFPDGPGHTVVIDVRTGEVLSIASAGGLSDADVKQFGGLPGPKTYTMDVRTGRFLSISRG